MTAVVGRAWADALLPGASPADGRTAAVAVWDALASGLAGTPRVRLGRWVSTRQGRRLVYDKSRELAAGLPTVPAALRVYDDQGLAQALGLDFDPKLVDGDLAVVEREAAAAAQLLHEAGARVVVDVSPTGGRHVWAPLAAAAAKDELLPLGQALQVLYRSLDVSPLRSVPTGCLTAPGSPAKRGGFRQLVTPLDEAIAAVARRSDPGLLDRLRERLAPAGPALEEEQPSAGGDAAGEAAVAPFRRTLAPPAAAVSSDDASPARKTTPAETTTVRPGGPRPLDAMARAIAEQGIWPATRRTARGDLWTGSEARQSLLASCAARGWALADVRRQLKEGRWPGLAKLYAKYGRHGDAQLRRDWTAALDYAQRRPVVQPGKARGTAVAQGHTSGETSTHGGVKPAATEIELRRAEHRHLRRMFSIMEKVALQEGWGQEEGARTRWAVLRALIVMGMRTGSRTLAVGTRSLTFGTGLLDHGTVAKVLRVLRDDPDGWIDRVQAGRGHDADRYELRIPDRYAHLHDASEPLPSGRLPEVHPVYAELGLAAWRLVEAIEAGVRDVAALIEASGVSRGHVYKLLTRLETARLVAPVVKNGARAGWRRTRRTLSAAARQLGIPVRLAARRERYRAERDQWRRWLERRGRQDWEELAWLASVDGPLWWPDWAQMRPPPDDPDPPTEAEAVRLLATTFDAVVLPH